MPMELASAVSLSQHNRLIKLATGMDHSLLIGDLTVERFEGTESICHDGFRFEIDCFSTSLKASPEPAGTPQQHYGYFRRYQHVRSGSSLLPSRNNGG